jgi:phage gpG-like protein
VSKNTALTRLDCHNNQLTSLDVSKNTALDILYCENNGMRQLYLPKAASSFDTISYTSGNPGIEVFVGSPVTAPVITTQPQGATYIQNGTAAPLTVAATANGTLSYQWYSNTTNSNSGSTLINGATAANYTPPTATVGTKYYYAVITNTTDGGSKTAASNTAAIMVNTSVTIPETPSITTQPQSATCIQNSTAAALAVAATANGTLSYQWYSNTTNSNSGGTLINGATAANYTPPTATVGTKYYYAVITNTTDGGSETAASNTAAITVNVPSAPAKLAKPTNLTATPTGNGAKLTWDAVDGAAAYKIYRSADGGKTFILVSTRLAKNFNGKTPYFDDTTAVNSGSYIYAIRAYDASLSNTTRSDEVTKTVIIAAKLAKPTSLTATATENGAKLTWDAVDGAAAYKIYRSADGGKTFTLVSTRLAKNFNGKTPYFDDTTAVNSGSYIYAIRAYDSSLSNVTRSDEVTATVTV